VITVKGILEKKKSKVITCIVTTILSIIAVLTNRVLELKIFEILEGSIEKIEILEVKMKIAANFKG
jgi:hypothetical protein